MKLRRREDAKFLKEIWIKEITIILTIYSVVWIKIQTIVIGFIRKKNILPKF